MPAPMCAPMCAPVTARSKFSALLCALLGALLLAGLITGPWAAAQASGDFVASDEAAARRLAAAIRIKTITPDSEGEVPKKIWDAFHRHLEVSFPLVHQSLRREAVLDHSLLYTWKGKDPSARPILLMAHMDVVPVNPENNWQNDPFAGVIKDGVIWGRGALDDKLSVLGILEAVERLLQAGFAPSRDVYLAFGHDEEREGKGAKAIAQRLKERSVQLEFVLDEGSVIGKDIIPGIEQPVAMIGLTEKGYLAVTLTAKAKEGKPAHSSMPPADTPIELLARALAQLADKPMASEIRPPVSDMLDALAPEMSFWQRLAMGNRWLSDPLVRSKLASIPVGNAMIRTTGVATIISAGFKENVIPQTARAVVNYRILPGDSTEGVLDHVKEVVADLEMGDIEIEVSHGPEYHPPPVSDPGSASYMALERCVRKVFPEALVAPALVIGGTDSRVYGEPDTAIADNVYRFLPVVLNETGLASIHGVNEQLPIQGYSKVIRFYLELLRDTAS